MKNIFNLSLVVWSMFAISTNAHAMQGLSHSSIEYTDAEKQHEAQARANRQELCDCYWHTETAKDKLLPCQPHWPGIKEEDFPEARYKIYSAQLSNPCDDTQANIYMRSVLFTKLYNAAVQRHQPVTPLLQELTEKIQSKRIDVAQEGVLLTFKDLAHRLLSHVRHSGMIYDSNPRQYAVYGENEQRLVITFFPCVHTPRVVSGCSRYFPEFKDSGK